MTKSLINEIEDKFLEIQEQDQDGDNDQDFAEVQIARMVASGMSKEDAIAKVKGKDYNEAVVAKDADEAAEMAKDPKFKDVDIKVEEEVNEDEVHEISTSAATPGPVPGLIAHGWKMTGNCAIL